MCTTGLFTIARHLIVPQIGPRPANPPLYAKSAYSSDCGIVMAGEWSRLSAPNMQNLHH